MVLVPAFAELEPSEQWNMLREAPLFSELGTSELAVVASFAHLRTFASGEMLGTQGEHASSVHLIAFGLVAVPSIVGTNSKLLLSRPDVFGISSLVPPGRYIHSAQADGECVTLEISAASLLAHAELDPSFGFRLLRSAARLLNELYQEAIFDAKGARIGNYVG